MTEPQDFPDTPQPLLPTNRKTDRPMFMVLAILAFLSTLTLLSVKSSFNVASKWRSEIETTATVQILPTPNADISTQAEYAKELLSENPQFEQISILPASKSAALLKPWLGDAPLPEELTLPMLLDVKLAPDQKLDGQKLQETLHDAGIEAIVDDHQVWTKEFRRSTRAVQTLSIFAFLMVAAAILAAVVFATRASLTSRRMLINVLHQVGATPTYSARLFARQFAIKGLKAGTLGAACAIIVLFFVGIFTAGNFEFIPSFKNGFSNFILAFLIPAFVALIAGITAWRTVLKTLYDEVYP